MVDIASWGWPQFTYLFLAILAFGISAAKHGEYMRYNIISRTVWMGFYIFILYEGGFF